MSSITVGAAGRRRSWPALELITFQRGSQPHVALLDLLNRAGVEPMRIHTVSSISAMSQLVEDGLGVATLADRRCCSACADECR